MGVSAQKNHPWDEYIVNAVPIGIVGVGIPN